MISELIREVMTQCGLRQKDLAEVLDVPLQRVKRLSGGEVHKLTPEESETLVTKLRIRPDWIVGGGQGPMRMTEKEHSLWLAARGAADVEAAGRQALKDIGHMRNGEVEFNASTYAAAARRPRESRLLDAWRRCNTKDQDFVISTAEHLSKKGKQDQ